jgi:outer membrane immunogenic protein
MFGVREGSSIMNWRAGLFAMVVAGAMAVGTTVTSADEPAWRWGGLYLGGQLGGQWGETTWTATSLRDPPGVVQPGWSSLGIDASSPKDYDLSAARIGIYLGYNWLFSPRWVGGVEFDFGHANRTTTAEGFPGCGITCNAFEGIPLGSLAAGGDVTSVHMDWDASVRVRLGYLVTPDLLLYATGGLAWQRIGATGTCGDWHTSNYCFGPGPAFGQPNPASVTQSTTQTGWTAGAGLEWHIFGNWVARGEYRYANFGTWNTVFPFGPSVNPFTGESGDSNIYRFGLKAETHIATFGLAYKFDW